MFIFRNRILIYRSGVMRNFTTQLWQEPKGHDTGIEIYNCIVRQKVPLILRNPNLATWYTCGPTVYDSSHIGHASCYVKLDILQRILRNHFRINLITAMNITDIDDKIIQRSTESGEDWTTLANRYETEFWHDLQQLNVKKPDFKRNVVENIPVITKFIKELLDKNVAYSAKDSSVYLRVKNLDNYGKFQNLNIEFNEHPIKESAEDFALWKNPKSVDEPAWETPWGGIGRPGWHIECSALATSLFGNNIDFHAGGLDLRFPHHENEEAQSCAYHGNKQWVNYWIHTGHLNIKGETDKMSKSLKNTISISEMLESFSGDDFRMACVLSNYRHSMEYSDEMMVTARNTLNKFLIFFEDCQSYIDGRKLECVVDSAFLFQKLEENQKSIEQAFRDDFDTAKIVKHLTELCVAVNKTINQNPTNEMHFQTISANKISIVAIKNYVQEIFEVFGFKSDQETKLSTNEDSAIVENLVNDLVRIRNALRTIAKTTKNRQIFSFCDQIRDKLKENAIEIKDHGKESSWKFMK